MVRKLKFHEQKLLKKVDFISWSLDNNLQEVRVMRKYNIQKREDYTAYNKLARKVRELAREVKELDQRDAVRTEATYRLLEKLYNMGIIPTRESLEECDKVTASSFARRRLPVVMARSRMCESISTATKLIQHTHVRVGPQLISDPAVLIPRSMEDFITWVDSSKIREHIQNYNNVRDDFDLMV